MNATHLSARLKERIIRNGPLSVADYMETCLADKDAGYYPSRQPIGIEGDFITAPEVSQIFGELVGLWAVAVWQSMGEPKPLVVVELGPGRGTLMSDAVRAWRSVPAFLEAASVALVETSPVLREAQRMALHAADVEVRWYSSLGEVPGGTTIILANEFFDALPIRQLIWRECEWRERAVRIGPSGAFDFCDGPVVQGETLDRLAGALGPEDGTILELRPTAAELLATVAERARHAPLAALIVDYGHVETACGDTLQAVARHTYADPLETPGDVDITAHVDFGALAECALVHGLVAYRPVPQAEFLLRLGLEARQEDLCKDATPEQAAEIRTATTRLIEPYAMGSLFKAFAVASPGIPTPPAFDLIEDLTSTRHGY